MFAAVGLAVGASLASQFRNLFLYNEVLTIVQQNYVEDRDPSGLIMESIRGMLKSLDPHSQILDAQMARQLRDEQKESFYGIGIQFEIIKGLLTVIAPIEGTPAYNAGLLAGDRIVEINGENARGISTGDVLKKLKGPKGTSVTITVEREGVSEPLYFTITRGKIPTSSVPYYFMLDDSVGYVRLIKFAEKTTDEMNKAIVDLLEQGMKSLILDLRSNGGGLLNQAIQVSDMFLDQDLPIVSTRGRTRETERVSYASGRTVGPHLPLVILINGGTASGSEIVAGAIQDMDRGVIVGTRSFGKGLVQTIFQLPEEWTLILTTQRYYTPSGRCIQKPYGEYDGYSGEFKSESESINSKEKYRTQSGRLIEGGGGICPDVVVEQGLLKGPVAELPRKNIFTRFGLHYAALHRELPRDFEVTDEMIDEFVAFAKDNGVEVSFKDLAEEDADYIKIVIKHRIVRSIWGNKEAATAILDVDDEVQKAIEAMPEAKRMLEEDYLPFVKRQDKKTAPPAEGEAALDTASIDLAA